LINLYASNFNWIFLLSPFFFFGTKQTSEREMLNCYLSFIVIFLLLFFFISLRLNWGMLPFALYCLSKMRHIHIIFFTSFNNKQFLLASRHTIIKICHNISAPSSSSLSLLYFIIFCSLSRAHCFMRHIASSSPLILHFFMYLLHNKRQELFLHEGKTVFWWEITENVLLIFWGD
jgi:hypothetical protein